MLHRKGSACAALALSLLFPLVMASSASAAPVEGPSGKRSTPARTLPEGPHGTLVWYRPTTVNLNVELPAGEGLGCPLQVRRASSANRTPSRAP